MAKIGDTLASAAVEKARRTGGNHDIGRAAVLVLAHVGDAYQRLDAPEAQTELVERLGAVLKRYSGDEAERCGLLDEILAIVGASVAGGAR